MASKKITKLLKTKALLGASHKDGGGEVGGNLEKERWGGESEVFREQFTKRLTVLLCTEQQGFNGCACTLQCFGANYQLEKWGPVLGILIQRTIINRISFTMYYT